MRSLVSSSAWRDAAVGMLPCRDRSEIDAATVRFLLHDVRAHVDRFDYPGRMLRLPQLSLGARRVWSILSQSRSRARRVILRACQQSDRIESGAAVAVRPAAASGLPGR